MTLSFVIPEFNIGGAGTPPLEFYRRGFNFGGSGSQPTWRDVILSGNTALTLVNAKADSLTYLKLFGGTEQTGTPTPANPVDIVCNNGALKMVDNELPAGYKRVLGYECNNDVLWQITGFKLMGSDTVRISFSVNAACNVFGCYQGTDAKDNYDLYVSVSSGSKYLRYADGTYLSYWSPSDMGQRFNVVFSPTGTSGMPQDSTWKEKSFTSENDLLIGSTTLTGTSSKLKGNLYGNIIVEGRLKLIPCERVSDGVLGYYDMSSKTFFEPTGTPTSLGYDGSHYVLTIDGTVETVSVTGNNFANVVSKNIVLGQTLNSNGVPTDSDNNYYYLPYIPIKPNTTYVMYGRTQSDNTLSTYNRIYWYDKNKQFLSRATYTANTIGEATAPSNAYYARFSVSCYNSTAKITLAQVLSFNWMFAQATQEIPYEPYYNGGSATAEMLLKVDNYKDEQNVTTGAVTRRVGIKILDGTENWQKGTSFFTQSQSYIDDVLQDTHGCYCSHFTGVATNDAATGDSNVCKIGANATTPIWGRIYIYADRQTYNTAKDFAQYLANQYAQGTPVILVYPLATAKTETVTAQPLTIQAGTNVVEITQASIDNLELEVSYKAGVEVTVTEIENAQLDNSVEVTVNG